MSADAPLVSCTLPGCAAKPGEPCVSTVTGELRDEPHLNRLARVRVVPGETYAPVAVVEPSTSARLREVEQDLAEARAAAARVVEKLLYARTELGRVQKALAASQTDLTAAKEQIEDLRGELARVRRQRDGRQRLIDDTNTAMAAAGVIRDQARADLDAARVQIDSDRELIDQLIADRAGLRKELEQAPAQVLSTRPPQECRCAPQIPTGEETDG